MTLTTRIVAALVLSALIPMAVVLTVFLTQARKRAADETVVRLEHARDQALRLVDMERVKTAAAADCAAELFRANREAVASVVSETVAKPAAAALAERCDLDRVEILSASGATLSTFDSGRSEAESVSLTERRKVATGLETLTLDATRVLGPRFLADVTAIVGGEAHLSSSGILVCAQPRVEVPVVERSTLCVSVTPADARDVRRDLLQSFAGVAPFAFLAALAVGLVLAARIARPIRELATRAESISAQHSRPITLLEERDETRRMTIAFDQMLDDLQASERRRLAAERVAAWEEIAKRLAHEIKNPLSPIQLAVQNLQRTKERAPAAFDEAFAVETRTILEEVASLRALVDEFAQFARLPRPSIAPCDPRAIVEQALALFAGRIEAMRVNVTVDATSAPPTLRADGEQLGRVLKNVVANALEAMDGAADRTLTVSVRGDGDRIVFTVRDTGRGFDAETLRRVFEPYFTTRAGRGGTGLGMAIARRIAIEHGGTLTASGAPGQGATITLTLPVTGPPQDNG